MDARYKDILKYYVIGYDANENKIYTANIFDNINIYNGTVELINDYLTNKDFGAFHDGLVKIVRHEMWARYQYELSVNEPFPKDLNKSKKIDFFSQFEPNSYQVAGYIIGELNKGKLI